MEPTSRIPIATANWVVEGKIIMGTVPNSIRQVDTLHEFGVKTFVCLCNSRELQRACKEYPKYAQSLAGVRFINCPIPNMGTIPDEKVQDLIKTIRSIKDGLVYVHCRAGVGRSGTICSILFGMENDFPPDRAMEEVAKLRKTRRTVNSPHRACPENDRQREQVRRLLNSPLKQLWSSATSEDHAEKTH